ncbi:hypothetical protein ncot_04290 [Nocardioides sp. JQ2195]|uniref:hypothetical protein n=1 Tax=Nocardioides sp. JQ2195 TaxID=2592334 RepID=UPI00143EB2DC|nr:hypothetical protein [Nocardioides sp. JQ2195]QIX25905.1 hypothetical protein ncot_04290 [Nocardioides sp. JQ2195]
MEWLMVAVAVAAVVALLLVRARDQRALQQRRDAELQKVKKVVEEDVTRFGEELTELHIDTLATELDVPMRQDYQRALDSYESAKALLHDVDDPAEVSAVTRVLEDGRYAQACVLARQDDEPLPQRRPPCFFNPRHGPAQTDVLWAPPGGQQREIPVCLADADRLTAGAEPDVRQVRNGNRMVPWYQGGPAYGAYADGYYGAYAMNGLFPAFLIGSMMSGIWDPAITSGDGTGDGGGDGGDISGTGGDGGDWSDPGGGDAGGDFGGGDAGGDFGGGDAGGGDFGGDFGGGDVGGGFDFGGFDF